MRIQYCYDVQYIFALWNRSLGDFCLYKRKRFSDHPILDAAPSTYSVMQSGRNSFYGDVVSDSFHKAFPDEDTILEQIFRSKYVRIVIMKILDFF